MTLSKEKSGLNIIKISKKYQQCQTTKHTCLRKSPNPDISYLHQATTQESIQGDEFRDTRDMIKSVRAKQIEKISNDLQNHGYILKQVWPLRYRLAQKAMYRYKKHSPIKHLQLYEQIHKQYFSYIKEYGHVGQKQP